MKTLLLLGTVLACHSAFAGFTYAENIGSTLQALAGDVSSSGDEPPNKPQISPIEKAMALFKTKTLLNCQLNEKPILIEMTKSLDSWNNQGFLRVTVPKPTGGGKIIFLEKYKQATHIDPVTNTVRIKVASSSIDEKGDTVVLQMSATPQNSQLILSEGDLLLSIKDFGSYGASQNQVKCNWGAGKTSWD